MLRRAIELDSTFVPPRIWLIPGLVRRGELAEARMLQQSLHVLEAEASPFEQAMIGWTDTFLENDLTGQERQLELALDYSPDDYILLFNLARTRYLLENYRGAIDALSPAVNARWDYAPAYYLFAASHHALGDDHEARVILESASTVKNRYPDTYALLAVLARREGDSAAAQGAEKEYARLQADAGLAEHGALASLGDFYLSDDMPWEAVKIYSAALALAPDRSDYREALADAHLMGGDTSGAIALYRRVLDQDSTRADRSALRQRLLTLTRSTTAHPKH
jgi:tetratricopeptide (TPR) repeat protein